MEKEPEKPFPEEILKLRKLHKQAYRYITDALTLDEKGGESVDVLEKIIKTYEKGILVLQHGLGINIKGSGEDYNRALVLQEKMKGNLEHAEGRIADLTVQIESIKSKPSENGRSTSTNGASSSKTRKLSSSKPQTTKPSQSKPTQPKHTTANGKIGKPVTTRTTKPTINKIASTPKAVQEPTEEQTKKISKLKNIDSHHANLILNEVVLKGRGISFDDVGGMQNAKQILNEIVILPTLRPELFTGLRAPARGLLLFGPPGNGKTLLAKALATEAKAVFFNISAATLTSKFIGEGEKMVRAMFAVARELQPAIIYIDEIDSLLSERKENEHEASRRLKTEFLVGFDGVIADVDERILVMGATNRPWDLDDAALRRLVKRVHVPLPEVKGRIEILRKTVAKHTNSSLTEKDYQTLGRITDGYSGSDLSALARDAALMAIRELKPNEIKSVPAEKVRPLNLKDFQEAMKTIRPSVSTQYLTKFDDWNKSFGTLT